MSHNRVHQQQQIHVRVSVLLQHGCDGQQGGRAIHRHQETCARLNTKGHCSRLLRQHRPFVVRTMSALMDSLWPLCAGFGRESLRNWLGGVYLSGTGCCESCRISCFPLRPSPARGAIVPMIVSFFSSGKQWGCRHSQCRWADPRSAASVAASVHLPNVEMFLSTAVRAETLRGQAEVSDK